MSTSDSAEDETTANKQITQPASNSISVKPSGDTAKRITPTNSFSVQWKIFWNFFYVKHGYKSVLYGLKVTIEIAVVGLLIGILIGTLIAVVKVLPKYRLLPRILERICNIYVGFFRGTPIMVQLLIGYFVAMPALGISGHNLKIIVGFLVFGMNSGAYVSEIMRSGIQAVDPGQLEAGRAVGLSYSVAMLKIVIPQAVKNILPTIGNEFITLIKETSVLSLSPSKI
jgi:polar amino acid transport system permease protein